MPYVVRAAQQGRVKTKFDVRERVLHDPDGEIACAREKNTRTHAACVPHSKTKLMTKFGSVVEPILTRRSHCAAK